MIIIFLILTPILNLISVISLCVGLYYSNKTNEYLAEIEEINRKIQR